MPFAIKLKVCMWGEGRIQSGIYNVACTLDLSDYSSKGSCVLSMHSRRTGPFLLTFEMDIFDLH